MSTTLYRHFAKDGALLYVGISLSWPKRTKSHARGSQWFDQVERVEIERFPTREAAIEAERNAIKAEKPKYNIMHNRPAKNGAARQRQRPWNWLDGREGEILLSMIKGPDAIIGPALVYRDDKISLMIAHGEFGSQGVLSEAVLGDLAPEMPPFAHVFSTVLTVSRPGTITMAEAQKGRHDVIGKLRAHLRTVEVFDTDLSMAAAYASRFPSEKSRSVLREVAAERSIKAGVYPDLNPAYLIEAGIGDGGTKV